VGDARLPSSAAIGAPSQVPETSSTALSLLDDPETRDLMLGQFFQFEGVNGAAIISSSGKVLAEDMRSNASLVTLAGFYMRGAGRIARDLGYNVFDGVIARAANGSQLLMLSMGATTAVLSIEVGVDPEGVRQEILGVES
jgi:predicted regulator of Ras-like GTPase activity (Roadblock/LC7/MglB family)